MKEREVESKERCRHETLLVQGIRVKRGAQPGDDLGHVDDLGHQTPGKLPGRVKLKLSVAEHDKYLMTSDNLFTVMSISLADSLFGFTKKFDGIDGTQITISQSRAHHGQVLKIDKKGMFNPGSSHPYGDLYVRINVEIPTVSPGKTLTVSSADKSTEREAALSRETEVEMRGGAQIWKRWAGAEESVVVDPSGKRSKDEL
eukprot:TRINITY_DN10724_c0_g1_i1.p1 TRINITY_DN10724_c0_g1~~TRINITY_DN10724_c0_g1_i1.p1  ORF type:complete len:201 (-),score=58.09 TRINITY_DN10724_c0_g1_i1:90-692(-)